MQNTKVQNPGAQNPAQVLEFIVHVMEGVNSRYCNEILPLPEKAISLTQKGLGV